MHLTRVLVPFESEPCKLHSIEQPIRGADDMPGRHRNNAADYLHFEFRASLFSSQLRRALTTVSIEAALRSDALAYSVTKAWSDFDTICPAQSLFQCSPLVRAADDESQLQLLPA